MSSSLKPNSERHGWQSSAMAPPLIKSAMISRGTCGIEAFFSCSPVRSASLTASRLRNTATGCPIFSMARANSSPVAPRQDSPVVMRFAGRDRRHQPATEDKTEQENDDPLHGYDLAPTRRLRRLDVLSLESAAASMAGPLTRSHGHRTQD